MGILYNIEICIFQDGIHFLHDYEILGKSLDLGINQNLNIYKDRDNTPNLKFFSDN
jgi:hypothetical protein